MQKKNTTSSWIQLILFTAFLFLLVIIPYAVYIRATTSHASVHITNLTVAKPVQKPTTVITPPPASTVTTCIPVDNSYTPDIAATPSSYLFSGTTRQVCFPPALPPFPFTWDSYKDFQHAFSFEVPSNWTANTTVANGVAMHNFYQQPPTASSSADISFSWVSGQDPYASNAAYFMEKLSKGTAQGTVYTKGAGIQAVFPDSTGYLLIQSSTADAAFYAFQHMLITLLFTQ